jgi:hypothetical protein
MDDIQFILQEDSREKKRCCPRQTIAKKKPKCIITPYDLNRKDVSYRPGKLISYQLPKCPKCKRYFIKLGVKYCHDCETTLKKELLFKRHSGYRLFHKKIKSHFIVYTAKKKCKKRT